MKNIKQHEEQYWHIPKIALLPIIGLIFFVLLSIGNYQLIDKQVVTTAFSNDTYIDLHPLVSSYLINIYPIVGEYILIALALISLVASLKKGYNNLKSYKESGLIVGLLVCLIEEVD